MARRVLLLAIRIYWLMPGRFRRTCLFKETCSHHVFRITKEQGFHNGIQALRKRYTQCCPTYSILRIEGGEFVLLKDNSLVERSEMRI